MCVKVWCHCIALLNFSLSDLSTASNNYYLLEMRVRHTLLKTRAFEWMKIDQMAPHTSDGQQKLRPCVHCTQLSVMYIQLYSIHQNKCTPDLHQINKMAYETRVHRLDFGHALAFDVHEISAVSKYIRTNVIRHPMLFSPLPLLLRKHILLCIYAPIVCPLWIKYRNIQQHRHHHQ